jgi:adenylate cyclase
MLNRLGYRKLLVGLAITLASASTGLLLSRTSLLKTMEWKIYDMEFRILTHPSRASRDIVMIKIVFIGTTAAGLHDLFPTPFGAQGKMPSMQIHATVVDNILSHSFLRPASLTATILLLVFSTLLVSMLGVHLNFWWALLVTGGIACVDAGAAGWSFQQGIWLTLVPTGLGLVIAQFTSVAYKYFVEDRAKRQIKALFSRYVAPAVVKELVEDPSKAHLGGQRREMTVLFSDIRGFTTLTEAGKPEDVILQLNQYFSRMVGLLFEHHGTLDKFVGDMIMALFNAPVADPDHAVQMALSMLRELRALNENWRREGKPSFDIMTAKCLILGC